MSLPMVVSRVDVLGDRRIQPTEVQAVHPLCIPIDPASRAWKEVAKDLQGNILEGFPGNHTRLILLRFPELNALKAGTLVTGFGTLATTLVTTALEQQEQAAETSGSGAPVGANVVLSRSGYEALGFGGRLRRAFPHPQKDPEHQNWFLEGMQRTGVCLGDPPAEDWEPEYLSPSDAMILLVGDDEQAIERATDDAVYTLTKFGCHTFVESGNKSLVAEPPARGKGQFIEHFGYVKGISQPRFFLGDEAQYPGDMEGVSIDNALVRDRLVRDRTTYGSYLVYRKLAQDTAGFAAAVDQLEAALVAGLDENKLEGDRRNLRQRALAMVVGRFPDGTPLAISDHPTGGATNEFTFGEDPMGAKCPLHAHIRKVRPRTEETKHRPRMIRRSVPYGKPEDDQKGLLFLSFQRNIHAQFGAVQREWMNGANSPHKGAGPDVLASQGRNIHPERWPLRWGHEASVPFRFEQFVTLRGGDYFFAPSKRFFRQMSGLG